MPSGVEVMGLTCCLLDTGTILLMLVSKLFRDSDQARQQALTLREVSQIYCKCFARGQLNRPVSAVMNSPVYPLVGTHSCPG